jgi:3-hydroxyacyl-CoA dehydrogenase
LGEREVAKVPDTPALPIKKVGVVGAGTMGSGIAMAFANSGLPVLLKEVDPVALERGMARIRKNDEKFGKAWAHHSRGKGSAPRFDSAEVELRGFNDSDLIIEAVFESLELKKQIFAELEKITKPECVLATKTSVLDIDTIAQSTSRPEMAVGLHFFNPANVMRLLEIVRGKHTSKPVLATALSLAKSLHKVGVVVGNCFGFVDNRMLLPYIREAIFLVKEGTTPEHVDRVLYDWGMAMGIFAVSDVIGIDVLTISSSKMQRWTSTASSRPFGATLPVGEVGRENGSGLGTAITRITSPFLILRSLSRSCRLVESLRIRRALVFGTSASGVGSSRSSKEIWTCAGGW